MLHNAVSDSVRYDILKESNTIRVVIWLPGKYFMHGSVDPGGRLHSLKSLKGKQR